MGRYQFLIYLIPVALAVMQTVYRAYQKKKAQLDAEAAERERQQSILRTGRDPLAEQAAAYQRQLQQQEAAVLAERQEALRQLRREQEEEEQPASEQAPAPRPNAGAGGPITRELWPGGPVIVIGGGEPAPRRQGDSQRQDTPQRRPEQVQQRRPEQVQSRSQQQSRKKPRQKLQRAADPESTLQSRQDDRHDAAYYQRERSLARMQASTTLDDRAIEAEPVFVRPSTPAQWRAALIAAEVLGTPVSMRDPETAPGGPSH